MIAGLRANGVEVIECHVPLWRGIEDRVETAGGGWASFGFMKRIVSVYARLLKQYFSLGKDYDVMVLGYPGQLDVFLARLLTWFHRKPLVLDLFMSIYLIALERDLDTQSKFSIRLLRKLEWAACRLPDLLICDTEAYRDWHKKTHGLQPERFRLVPTGADDRVFKPVEIDKPDDGLFRVLYYGTFIPNHGVKYIIEAANLLQDHPEIQFELVGRGPDKA
ncbi:MAG TPA: glycosyltransferase family 4 protein, partial [Chloroflexi bacterium]|nr:glycosyltransferase family 4 protein [Chloroflexota bacterium]